MELNVIISLFLFTGVEVYTTNSRTNGEPMTYRADAVVCTLPLGVLKESLRGNGINSIQFIPPLPDWKTAAIQRMGFGNLNKVMECTAHPFYICNGKFIYVLLKDVQCY